MRLFIVTKSPVDLDDARQVVGVFSSRVRAQAACIGAGTFDIFAVVPDRPYGDGTLLDVERRVVMNIGTL